MKLLLDECLPHEFRHSFPLHECHTVDWAGFKSLKNGALIAAAESAGYEALITVDRGIPHEHRKQRIAIVVICVKRAEMPHLVPRVGAVLEALRMIRPGDIVVIL